MLRKIKLFSALLAVVASAGIISYACTPLSAKPRPTDVALSVSNIQGSSDSLVVVAEWTGSMVGVPNGPIVYPVSWSLNGVAARNDTVSVLSDTLRFARAPIGQADTVVFTVRALYTVNGKLSNAASVTRLFTNSDLQTPSVPVIIRVDTLP